MHAKSQHSAHHLVHSLFAVTFHISLNVADASKTVYAHTHTHTHTHANARAQRQRGREGEREGGREGGRERERERASELGRKWNKLVKIYQHTDSSHSNSRTQHLNTKHAQIHLGCKHRYTQTAKGLLRYASVKSLERIDCV